MGSTRSMAGSVISTASSPVWADAKPYDDEGQGAGDHEADAEAPERRVDGGGPRRAM